MDKEKVLKEEVNYCHNNLPNKTKGKLFKMGWKTKKRFSRQKKWITILLNVFQKSNIYRQNYLVGCKKNSADANSDKSWDKSFSVWNARY